MRSVPCLLLLLVAACGSDAPEIQSVLVPEAKEEVGPYMVEAWVVAPVGVGRAAVRVVNAGQTIEFAMSEHRREPPAELWQAALPGASFGTTYRLYVVAIDKIGRKAVYPTRAPQALLELSVTAP